MQASRDRYESILRQAEDAIIVVDASQTISLFNNGAERVFGYSTEEVIGKPIDILLPERLVERYLGRVDTFVQSPVTSGAMSQRGMPLFGRRKDGTEFPVEVSLSKVGEPDDVEVTSILRDISERVRTEDEIRKLGMEQAAIAEIGRIIGSTLDIDEVYERFADEVSTLIPFDRLSVDLVPEDEHVGVSAYRVGTAVEGRQRSQKYSLSGTTVEAVVRDRKGLLIAEPDMARLASQYPGLRASIDAGHRSFMTVPLISDDQVIGTITIRSAELGAYSQHDLELAERIGSQIAGAVANAQLHSALRREAEDRTLAQVALMESEERNRAIVQAIPDLIFRVRGDGTFLDYQGARDELSLPPEVWLGKPLSAVLPPEVAAPATGSINRAILTGRVQEFEYTLPVSMPEGEVRDWEGRAVKAGEDEVLILARDITERKRLSAELLQAQKMEAVGNLAGGIAHDFNNMLTAIASYTDLAAARLGMRTPVRDYLDEVRKAADRAASLTRQLLVFSRRQIVNPKVIDLNDIILDMDKMLRRLIREDIELVTLPAENLRLVQADPGHLEQVLMNLAVNASDAMPEGGKLVIETLNVDVDDDLASRHADLSSGDYVGLTVRDTGEGMTKEVRSRVFEPFFTTKETGKGTGLGLSTVYGIVTQNGGAITVESEQGVGTTFRVLLPAVSDGKEDLPLRDDAGFLPTGSETILLVEDEPLVRGVGAEVLRHQGYTVLEASNGVEALEAALNADEPIDLLVADVVMPLMGGKELADRLKESHAEIRVLYTTGYTEDTALIREVAADTSSLLQKPFGPTELTERVRRSLDGS